MTTSTNVLADVRKFLAAATGAIATIVSAGLIDGTAERWTVGVLSAATAFVVYLVPNSGARSTTLATNNGAGAHAVGNVPPATGGTTTSGTLPPTV